MSKAFQKKPFAPGQTARRFLREEDGVMTPHILVFFFLMLIFGGISIDVMRFEARRVSVQNTLDRATLAVANMNQAFDLNKYESREAHAEALVTDHFEKAGIGHSLEYVRLDDGMNYRVVEARASVVSNNFFMSILDVPILQTMNASQAEQRITDIEIILVLDVSGSMAGSKLSNLKVAARDFVDQIKATDLENRISIAVVPYNAQVNLGAPLRSFYNATHLHGVAESNCLELPASVFSSLALSRTVPLPMMAHADTESTSSSSGYVAPSSGAPVDSAAKRWCNANTNNAVTLPSKDPQKAKDAINALTAEGNTSILLGMRWATALIDPSARTIYDNLILGKKLDSNMSGRPFDYHDRESMKVIVLMTDGEHVAHNRVTDDYKVGDADNLVAPSGNTAEIWRANSDKNYSVFHSSRVDNGNSTKRCNSRPFYVPHLNAWHSRPWNGSAPNSSTCYSPTASYTGATLQQWQEIWAVLRVDYVARQFFGRPLGNSAYTAALGKLEAQYASVADMNTRLKQNCTVARNAGILVYGIAFQAPAAGKKAIQDCTSTPTSTYYFDVTETSKIKEAFRLIATNLSQLRLTQ